MKRSTAKHIILSVIFLGIVIGILFLAKSLFGKTEENKTELNANSERVEFLNNNGLIVTPDPETQEIRIPEVFGKIYEEYNELQQTQGFDLKKYAGEDAVLYSYTVLNYPDFAENVRANLVICRGTLIACDITLNEENGFTKALIANSGT